MYVCSKLPAASTIKRRRHLPVLSRISGCAITIHHAATAARWQWRRRAHSRRAAGQYMATASARAPARARRGRVQGALALRRAASWQCRRCKGPPLTFRAKTRHMYLYVPVLVGSSSCYFAAENSTRRIGCYDVQHEAPGTGTGTGTKQGAGQGWPGSRSSPSAGPRSLARASPGPAGGSTAARQHARRGGRTSSKPLEIPCKGRHGVRPIFLGIKRDLLWCAPGQRSAPGAPLRAAIFGVAAWTCTVSPV